MSIDPAGFESNEAWLFFQLSGTPIQTEEDGEFHAVAIMEVSTGMIFGLEMVPAAMQGLPEILAKKLLSHAEKKAGERAQKLFLASGYDDGDLRKVATAMGIQVKEKTAIDLNEITREAREGFDAHMIGSD